MGRYLDLVQEALAELKAGQETTPARQPSLRLDGQDSESEPALDYDINDKNDRRVRAEEHPLWADPASPDVQGAQREAERLGVLGKSAHGLNTGQRPARWMTGSDLDALPEPLQGLVCAREEWTPQRWAHYLQYRAGRCDERHRDVAELYQQAARLLWGNSGESSEST
ncbi:MAG: hypothetical protein JSU86_00960 [Phycisphaerales bacterium]|nr:MAG: hypothetical protein JSU86_00960 [Phycisphaerales bacterium]